MSTYTPKEIVKGDDLMLFVTVDNVARSLAYATSHQMTMSSNVADTNSKDHGNWEGKEVNKRSWEITTDNLFTDADFGTLFDAWVNGTKLDVVFCPKAEDASVIVADGDAEHYTPTDTVGKHAFAGKAIITNLTANAATGEKATFSATLSGSGALTHTVIAAAPGE